MARIWVMDAEMLGYKNLIPVADEMRRRGHSVMIFGAEVFADQIKNDIEVGKRRTFVDFVDIEGRDNPERIFEHFEHPDLILTGIALRPGTGLNIVAGTNKDTPKVALLGGYAGKLFKSKDDGQLLFSPNIFLVNDPSAAKIVGSEFPHLAKTGKILVIGNPHYDELSRADRVGTRKEAREKLGIKDHLPVVFYAGSSASREGHEIISEGEALKMAVNVVNRLMAVNDFHFIARHHPRLDKEGKEIQKTGWLDALKKLEKHAVDSSHMKTEEVLAASDLVIAIPGGIVSEAAVFHKQVVSLATPEVMRRYRLEWGTSEFPTAELGCCAEARSQNELEEMIKLGLNGKLDLLENQERHFKTDGKNTQRVCDFLETLLN